MTGGKLVGFESTQQSTSAQFDRHIFIRNDGRLSYGGWGGGSRIITTPGSYNDGKWHHLVLTARPIGGSPNQQSTIYVDGTSVATGNTSSVSPYAGWWRAGYGSLPEGSGYPASADFTGTIDNFAVYNTELPAARVAAHFAAR